MTTTAAAYIVLATYVAGAVVWFAREVVLQAREAKRGNKMARWELVWWPFLAAIVWLPLLALQLVDWLREPAGGGEE